MLNKVKKIFFNGVFGLLYVGFTAQLVFAIYSMIGDFQAGLAYAGLLSIEWLVLISARYLSKKSSGNAGGNRPSNGHYRR